MGQPVDARLTPELARDICLRTGGAAVLDGSIRKIGNKYVLKLRTTDCRSGGVLDEQQVQAATKEDVLHAVTSIASRFRNRAGESLTTIEERSTPLEEATTSSLEALKAFSVARNVHFTINYASALHLYDRAIEIDPKFALAYAYRGHVFGELGESDYAAENITKAWQLRDRASTREQLFIDASYQLRVTGNMDKLQQVCEALERSYPRDPNSYAFRAAQVYQIRGEYEKAAEEARRSIAVDPGIPFVYDLLAFSYENLDKLDDAEKSVQLALDRKLDIPDFLERRYKIAFLRNDQAGMDREVALGRGKSQAEDMLSLQEALTAAYSGHLRQARTLAQRAVDLARKSSQRERAALYQTDAALREAFFGNAVAARQNARAALDLSKDREVEYGAAFAFALVGDSVRAETLGKDLERRFPEDTSVRMSYLPALRGLLMLNHGDPSKSIEILQTASPYDLGAPRCSHHGFYGALYPVYVRGEAYLAALRGAEAAVEFQKILNHRGIVVDDPIGALARLQLGRSFVISGDKTKAKAAYQDFLTLWKDADPGIPVFQRAKAEFARL
jgi:tetratricopeptide (TPR) repeat protein